MESGSRGGKLYMPNYEASEIRFVFDPSFASETPMVKLFDSCIKLEFDL